VERLSHGYRVNCSIIYNGRHAPELRWSNADNATVQSVRSWFVEKSSHRVVTLSAKVPSALAVPSSCQMSVPLYRCTALSRIYARTFPTGWINPTEDGEFFDDEFDFNF